MKMGYATMSFGEQPIDIAIGAVSRLGFDGIELCTWKGLPADLDLLDEERQREIKNLAEEAGRIINAVGGHVGYIETDEKKRIASITRTKRNIDLAVELGATVVDTFSGASREDIPEERAWELLVDSISDCADYGAERGVFIGLNRMLICWWILLRRCSVSSVKSSSLKVDLDVSHFAIFGLHIPDVVRLLSRHIIHTHLKDARGLYPDFQFLIPGEGDLNIREFVMALKENGYQGFVTSEISVMRQGWRDYDPFYAAELTHRTVSYVFKELGLGH